MISEAECDAAIARIAALDRSAVPITTERGFQTWPEIRDNTHVAFVRDATERNLLTSIIDPDGGVAGGPDGAPRPRGSGAPAAREALCSSTCGCTRGASCSGVNDAMRSDVMESQRRGDQLMTGPGQPYENATLVIAPPMIVEQ